MSTLCDGDLPAFDRLLLVAQSSSFGGHKQLFVNGDEKGQHELDDVQRKGGNIRRKVVLT